MADSIEISLDDVERIAAELGFKTLRREMVVAGFNTNERCGRLMQGWPSFGVSRGNEQILFGFWGFSRGCPEGIGADNGHSEYFWGADPNYFKTRGCLLSFNGLAIPGLISARTKLPEDRCKPVNSRMCQDSLMWLAATGLLL